MSAVKARMEQYRAALGDEENITYEYAEEEVVCNSLGKMLSSQRAMNELAAEHRSVFSRVWRAIKSFFDKIIKGITGNVEAGAYSYKSREERIVSEESKRKYAELEKMFVAALKAANEAAQDAKTVKYTADQKNAQNGGNSALTNTNEQNMHVSAENNNKTPGVTNTQGRYSIKYPYVDENDIVKNMDVIADMEAVAAIDVSKLEKTGKSPMDTFNEYFNSLGNNIASDVFGDIALPKSSAKSEIRHGITAEKIASIEAIPAVIEQGKVIFHKAKEGGVERIVVCAPIKIGEADYYMGVMLQRDAKHQRLYLHNVVSVAIEREATSVSKDNLVTTGALENENHLSITSIIQKALNVKTKKQKTSKKYSLSDREYMSAVERGDMEAAQAMVDEAARAAGYTDKLYHGTHQFGFTEFDPSYSDDKISLFVAGSPDLAQTYSGRYGTRKISDAYKVDGLTIDEVVERLNKEAHESYDGEQLKIEYEIMYLQDVNRVINEVNDGVDWLSELVGKKIKEYAERMATDFDDKDAKTHKKLVELKEILDNYQYAYMSTPIYMLLHYTDAFDDGARVADLEYKIRLMNKLQNADTSNGVVVKKDLDGYGVSILYFDEARLELKQRNAEGNYALYGNPRNQLVIDGGGQNWNDLRGWAKAIHHTLDNTVVERKGDYYRLYDKKTGNEIFHGRLAVNTYTEGLSARMRHIQMIEKSNNVLDARAEYHHTTRDIARFAKDLGYESVKFENIEDNGGQGESVGAGDVYAYFEPSNLKSADPVTYDDSGNVIPLSERFNPAKKDIRYSLPETIENSNVSWYNEIKLNSAEYSRIQSEALTWDAKKRGVLLSRTLSNEITYRYYIDNAGVVHVVEREPIQNIHEKRNTYDNEDRSRLDQVAEGLRTGQRNDSSDIDTVQNGRKPTENDRSDNRAVRSNRRSDGAVYSKGRTVPYRRQKITGYVFNDDGSTTITYADGRVENRSAEEQSKRKGKYSLTDREQRERLAEAFYQMSESNEERAKVNEYRKELHKIDDWVAERDELIYRFGELKGIVVIKIVCDFNMTTIATCGIRMLPVLRAFLSAISDGINNVMHTLVPQMRRKTVIMKTLLSNANFFT